MSAESVVWPEGDTFYAQYNYFIDPLTDVENTYVLKAGTIVETYAMRHLRGQYMNVFLMGQNGGFRDTAELIRMLKAMIAYSKSNKYIVISFHKPNYVIPTVNRMKEMEDSLGMAFGYHFINLRQYMCDRGLKDAKLIPTKVDRDSVKQGQVPPQLLAKDGLHFNDTGYRLIASLVHQKMRELSY